MKPKWQSEVRPIRRRMSSWPMATSAPYTIEISASATTNGVAHCDASGNSPRQKRIIPKVPILSRTQTSSTLVPGVAFSVASASQVCTGNIGALTAKAKKKPSEQPLLGARGRCRAATGRSSRYVGLAGVRGHDVQADDRGEHQQTAGELEDQELDRRLLAALTAEAADQEVHRDQRRLEQHVEQEDVGGRENAERQRLEGQHPGEERLGVAPWSASFHEATMTTGTSMVVSSTSTRPMPSTPRA